ILGLRSSFHLLPTDLEIVGYRFIPIKFLHKSFVHDLSSMPYLLFESGGDSTIKSSLGFWEVRNIRRGDELVYVHMLLLDSNVSSVFEANVSKARRMN
uniref:Uncharacterized protein n=1 Tax=Brassica oleracea var. oleracea TaxID=109376 RepID=A0A0D3BFR1_BRAOL